MIELYDGYVILIDEYNYTLAKTSGVDKRSGKTTYTYKGHYSGVIQAVEAFRQELIRKELQDDCLSLLQASQRVIEIDREVAGFIKDSLSGVFGTLREKGDMS